MGLRAPRRLWSALAINGLVIAQLTTGVFPIPVAPIEQAAAAGFLITLERIDEDDNPPVEAGDIIEYEVTITNNDTKIANARIITPIPDELKFESGSAGCYEETFTNEVICPEQPLGVGDSRNVRLEFSVRSSVQGCTSVVNQADVWNDDANPPSGIAPAWSNIVETFTVDCTDLAATKDDNLTTPLEVGKDVVYTITVTNNGEGEARDVYVEDTEPDHLEYKDSKSDRPCSKPASSSLIRCGPYTIPRKSSIDVDIAFTFVP